MIVATLTPSSAPDPDPTLSTLIPQRSLRRNVLLASAALFLFVGVWTSPQVLRPSVVSNGAGTGAAILLARQHQVLTVVGFTPEGWPTVGVQSVGDHPGARVAGVWVFADSALESQVANRADLYPTGLDYLRASFPDRDFGAASRLPHRLDPGKPAQIFILWDVTDCSLLTQTQQPQIEVTSILGITTHQQLADWAAPFFAVDAPPETGACPTP